MSLQLAAQHLASKGRNGDTTLVHMTKGEARSLQELAKAHGGSLTVNPHTGLPEASFLSSLLPTLIGFALAPATGGASLGLSEAWMAPALVGGIETARTGSLKKGLMAGLGAYGGGSLAQGLAGTGAAELGKAAAQEATDSMMGPANAAAFGSEAPVLTSAEQVQQQVADKMANLTPMDKLSAGFKSPNLVENMGGWGNIGKAGLMAAAPVMADAMTPAAPPADTASKDLGLGYTYNPGTASPFPSASPIGVENQYFPGQGYTRISQADRKALYGYAGGGDIQGDPNMMQMPTYDPVVRMAHGGLSHLGDYSDGGRLLRGPGDGVSDSIPAVIGKKQPARLADGEFVVPARIVSELGNGSTEAGARQLYKMMDRVQNARTKTVGKGKIAKNTKAARYLPA